MASNNRRKSKKKQVNRSNKKVSGTSSRINALKTRAKQQMRKPVVSSSGTTAIDSKNTLSNIGNFIGKAAGIASKFLPGVGGMVASGISDLLNDPEWWESIPGQSLTCNEPLSDVSLGYAKGLQTGDVMLNDGNPSNQITINRPVYGQVVTTDSLNINTRVISISDDTMTQYVMPAIRKIINAVPLQSASAYKGVLSVNITLYALLKMMDKYDFFMQNGKPYLPDMNVALFPMLQVDNYASFTAIRKRVKEYLSANVRIPHTMCEYIAWRFGRIYKTIDSEKSALMFYDIFPLHNTAISTISDFADALMAYATSTAELQKAQTDLYLVYGEHVQDVQIKPDTQYSYDKKEFMLRTNLDIINFRNPKFSMGMSGGLDDDGTLFTDINPVVIDSHLDNKTVFMASTVSTTIKGASLFPVKCIFCCRRGEIYIHQMKPEIIQNNFSINKITGVVLPYVTATKVKDEAVITGIIPSTYDSEDWTDILADQDSYLEFLEALFDSVCAGFIQFYGAVLYTLADMKALDIYNVPVITPRNQMYHQEGSDWAIIDTKFYDLTNSTMDMGTITDSVLNNEHVYAAANLLNNRRKQSITKAEAEVEVAQDLVETLEDIDMLQ